MNWRTFLTLGALTFTACAGGGSSDDSDSDSEDEDTEDTEDDADLDSDGDGLSDAEEEELGLDASAADSDGDGLDDKEEVDLGLDPLEVDTDGDGYTDAQEVHAGTDGTDASDVIYVGGWPYSIDKDELDEADVPATVEKGQLFPHFKAVDQYGDRFDIWDLKNTEGKYIIVDISAEWCGPCNAMSAWLDGIEPYASSYDSSFPGVREAIDNGDVYWVTVLGQDVNGGAANPATIARWSDAYPHPMIPIIPDRNKQLEEFTTLSYWPTVVVLFPNMEVAWKAGGLAGWDGGVTFVANRLAEQ